MNIMYRSILILFLNITCCICLQAQISDSVKLQRHSLYLDVGGRGLFSASYDYRKKHESGYILSWSVGAAPLITTNNSLITLNAAHNLLIPFGKKGNKYWEAGFGISGWYFHDYIAPTRSHSNFYTIDSENINDADLRYSEYHHDPN